jgi:glycosyltransferase involved in cell wall biosynthesis
MTLENIIKLFKKYNNANVAFAFIGDGTIKNKLMDICKEEKIKNTVFIPYQDKQDLIYSLNSADVHLVVNAEGIKGISVPSKIYGVMATNVPILGILENNSEAWNIINESECGILAEAGNYQDIQDKLDYIINHQEEFISKHLTGRKYLENHFTKDRSINKYIEEIEKL